MSESEQSIEYARTVALTVAYDGAPFAGFARQPGQSTVQGELERALATVYRRTIDTTCAGRTDAGVHALGQVVSFDLSEAEFAERPLLTLRRSLNALTSDAVSVREVEERPFGFSARFDATSREYRYRICIGPVAPVFLASYAWWIRTVAEPDTSAMRAAAAHLIGEHDFKSFCVAVSAEGKPTCRYVERIDITEEEELGERYLQVRIVGNAFLHSMVRTIVGSLVEVGLGRRTPDWMRSALEACDRAAAGPTAPAQGLTFYKVSYDGSRRSTSS